MSVRGNKNASKMSADDVRLVRALIDERERLRREASQLTNRKIAEKMGVHYRTIDRISAGWGWADV